jgi:hypothetical protein
MTKLTISLEEVKDAIEYWLNGEILKAEKFVSNVEFVPAGKEFQVTIQDVTDDTEEEAPQSE